MSAITNKNKLLYPPRTAFSLKYNVLYSTVQYSTVRYSTVLYQRFQRTKGAKGVRGQRVPRVPVSKAQKFYSGAGF